MKLFNSLVVLLLFVILLIVSANINKWIDPLDLDDNQVQALQLALTLVAIFLNAHYQRQNLDRRLRVEREAEREKEVRQHRLNLLDRIEDWLTEVTSTIENISVLRGLSERDELDGKLIVGPNEIKPIQEQVLRLSNRGLRMIATAAGIMGVDDDEDKDLTVQVALLWVILDNITKTLTQELPDPDAINLNHLVKVRLAIDKARCRELDRAQ